MRILGVTAITTTALLILVGCQSADAVHSSNSSIPNSTNNSSKGTIKTLNTLLKVSETKVKEVEINQYNQHLHAILIAPKFTLNPSYGLWSIPNNQKVNMSFPKQISTIVQQTHATLRLELVNSNPPTYEIQYESLYTTTKISNAEIERVKRYVNEIRYSFSGVSGS